MATGPTATNELVPGFSAEDDLERAVASDLEIRRGWAFRVQGTGHPERIVGAHVAAILRNIGADDGLRSPLRFVALVHDSMKWAVRPELPWSPDNDHAVLARRVAERHTGGPRLLQTIELHDEAYWVFKSKPDEPMLSADSCLGCLTLSCTSASWSSTPRLRARTRTSCSGCAMSSACGPASDRKGFDEHARLPSQWGRKMAGNALPYPFPRARPRPMMERSRIRWKP